MRFFTPELYLKFGSADDALADQADQQWEAATVAYRKHVDTFRDIMPPAVAVFEKMCFHDAQLLAGPQMPDGTLRSRVPSSNTWPAITNVCLSHRDEVWVLTYVIYDDIRQQQAPPDWPNATSQPLWLYDEFDLADRDRNMFVHRILLGDGRLLEIPFLSVIVDHFSIHSAGENGGGQRAKAAAT